MDFQFLPLLLIAGLALLLILNFRRQKRVVADAQRLQSSLANGDRVMTTSGLHATVVGIADEATIELEIAPGVRTRWLRAAIRERVTEYSDKPAVTSAPPAAPLDGSAHADNS